MILNRKSLNIAVVLSFIVVASGCATTKKVYPKSHKYSKVYTKKVTKAPAAYRYPERIVPTRGVRVVEPYSSRGSHSLKVSRSMRELDRDSASVRPTLVYSNFVNRVNYSAQSVDLTPIKGKILNYINALRASRGAGALRWSQSLENAASAHSGDMATNNFLGHIGSGKATDLARKSNGRGSNFYERIVRFGYPMKAGELAGEILTYTKDRVVGNRDNYFHFIHAMDNFQRSSRHSMLLMNPRFRDVGVSAYRDRGRVYWSIEFGEGL